jgi:hypothetical protein
MERRSWTFVRATTQARELSHIHDRSFAESRIS